ncbi:hypothetical protein L916_11688 [Phytophthora nicotianae]|uniref:Uncharacterized protein n=1 Tax=Phytophthora nicotianae TaxID=4792 RepID=W2IS45_PHYNI|nr:hypothetical protein L916_11688 [Phytophthora nicotianae]
MMYSVLAICSSRTTKGSTRTCVFNAPQYWWPYSHASLVSRWPRNQKRRKWVRSLRLAAVL